MQNNNINLKANFAGNSVEECIEEMERLVKSAKIYAGGIATVGRLMVTGSCHINLNVTNATYNHDTN